ncbi:hypothetical protein JYT61_00980 [bacterium AH-315-E10]|nr:hypothetical protein [bacterium AH-315-E10]
MWDPKGPLTKNVRYPVYEAGGPDHFYPGFYSQNARCIYALLKSGVDLDSGYLSTAVDALTRVVDGYGIPDYTNDLAWLTIIYCNLPAEEYPTHKKLAVKLVNKLLLGQKTKGPALGMWGPLSIHNELVNNMLKHEQELFRKTINPWKAKLKKKPGNKRYEKKLNQAKRILSQFHEYFDMITTSGLQFSGWARSMKVHPSQKKQELYGYNLEDVTLAGLPYYIYKEDLADIESTSIALFALYEAKRNGYLPGKIAVPRQVLNKGMPLIRTKPVQDMIADTINTLVKLQKKDGTWDTCNFWFPVKVYDMEGVSNPHYDDKKYFVKMENENTFESAADGYLALNYALSITEKSKNRALERAEKSLRKKVFENFDKKKWNQKKPAFRSFIEIEKLTAILATPLHPDNGFLHSIKDYLLNTQHATGSWWSVAPRRDRYYDPSSSLQARRYVVLKRNYEKKQAKLPEKKRRPYPYKWPSSRFRNFMPALRLSTMSTTASMMFLSDTARPPMAVVWGHPLKDIRMRTVKQTVDYISRKHKQQLSYVTVNETLPEGYLFKLPVIHLNIRTSFKKPSPGAEANLIRYLKDENGLLLVEVPKTDKGKAIYYKVVSYIKSIIPGSLDKTIKNKNGKVTLKGLIREGKKHHVIFLPTTSKRLSRSEASFVAKIFEERTDPLIFDKAYATDPEMLRAELVAITEERKRAAQAAVEKKLADAKKKAGKKK